MEWHIPEDDPFWIEQYRRIARYHGECAAYNRERFPTLVDLIRQQEESAAECNRRADELEARLANPQIPLDTQRPKI